MKEKQEEPNELDYKQVIRDGLILEITGALIRGRYVEAKKILDCDLGELNRKSVIEGVIQKLESYGITDDEIKKYLDVLNKKENLFYKFIIPVCKRLNDLKKGFDSCKRISSNDNQIISNKF